MAKINISVDLGDEILDDVAIQAIKNKVRSMVDKEFDKKLDAIIEEKAERQAGKIAEAIRTIGWYRENENLREAVRKKLIEKATDMSISNDAVKAGIDDLMKPVRIYARGVMSDFDKQRKNMEKEISDKIKSRVDAVFKATMVEALAEVLAKKGEIESGK